MQPSDRLPREMMSEARDSTQAVSALTAQRSPNPAPPTDDSRTMTTWRNSWRQPNRNPGRYAAARWSRAWSSPSTARASSSTLGRSPKGSIPIGEVQRLVDDQQLKVGDTVYVVVVQSEGRSEHAVLSLNRARSERGWSTVQTMHDEGAILNARIVEVNRGGLVAEVEGLRGFIPLSQIAQGPGERGSRGTGCRQSASRADRSNAFGEGHRGQSQSQPSHPFRASGNPGVARTAS